MAAKTRRKASGKAQGSPEKCIKDLEAFLGVSRETFFDGRDYFDWWFRPPVLVDLEPLPLGEIFAKYDVMSSESFWNTVKKLNWPKIRKSREAKDKAKQWLIETFDTTAAAALQNRYFIIHRWLQEVLNAYVVATGDSPGVSDDGTMDLLDECIGRGQAFFRGCMQDPKKIVDLARSGKFWENFSYLFHALLHDREDRAVPHEDQLLSWKNLRSPVKPKGGWPSGVRVDRVLVRQFQVAYSTIPQS